MHWRSALLLASLLALPGMTFARTADEGTEFYEKKIRPLLAEHCIACHGPKKQRSGLRVDSPAALLKGGDHGPAVVPRDLARSVLLKAVAYEDNDLRMPPKGKLRDDQLQDLKTWIERGAPAPTEATADAQPLKEFNLAERRQHWCYQPLRVVPPPPVQRHDWPRDHIDKFLLAKMEAAGLSPAPTAEKHTWLRRVSFDLTGLPPSVSELRAFLADESSEARAKVVDRLLASPHYGERWARHWLDLVRFAETLGHEFDFDVPNAWRYRDYVIRALNADLPYDRFVVEHLAGDLLPDQRRHPTENFNESVIATGFWWLGEGKQAPVDVRQEQGDRIDNQLDVFGKAFLAQTIACARCHDHKFDAISTRDYYSLAGYLKSSRYQQAFLDDPSRLREPLAKVAEAKERLRSLVSEKVKTGAQLLAPYLLAAQAAFDAPDQLPDRVNALAAEQDLDAELLGTWLKVLQSEHVKRPGHPLFAWNTLANSSAGSLSDRRDVARKAWLQAKEDYDRRIASFPVLAEFRGKDFGDWSVTGQAFGASPSKGGELIWVNDQKEGNVYFLPRGFTHSGLLAPRLQGVLRSPTMTLARRYVHFQAAGRGTRINVVVDGFTLIREPIYGGLSIDLNDDRIAWRTIDVGAWRGHRAYVELQDDTVAHPAMNGLKGGYLALDAIRWSDVPGQPPDPPQPMNLAFLNDAASTESLAASYGERLKQATSPATSDDVIDLANFLLGEQLLPGSQAPASRDAWRRAVEALRAAEARLPEPTRAPAMADGTGEDELIFLRGNHKTPGPIAARGLPTVLAGEKQPTPPVGSGRLELAQRLVNMNQAQLARVVVNRLWHHHFGTGIVATPDDFGRMGVAPSQPELLDFLASDLVLNGWSLKRMHRMIVLSSAYGQASVASAEAMQKDPRNSLLSSFPVLRLEAETIRDAMLATSGRLDPMLYGPGVMPYLTPFMEGRGRPGQSGPLDGQGRRSIYLAVRRNFINPMFLAFDYPTPSSTIGRRTVSNVPAQALTLLNDPFVLGQARLWAERALRGYATDGDCIKSLYITAFAREPRPDELANALHFLDEQSQRLGKPKKDVAVWTDLCHVLFNVKEFIYVP